MDRRKWRLAFGGAALALWLQSGCAADDEAIAKAFALHARYLADLAVRYEHGEGMPRDASRAAALYCEAARLGDAEAMHALGWMYANGRGLERNDEYAGTLFAMAAFLGNTQSERLMRFTGPYTGATPDCLLTPPELLLAESRVDDVIDALPLERQRIARLLVQHAGEYGIQPRFALAIALTESNLNPAALSPKSAMGVMQLIPETAERFNVKRPYDAEENIKGGLAYLRWLLAYFRGDIALVAAGYNAGEGAVDKYRGVPPYPETKMYVQRILSFVRHQRHPYDARVVAPSAAFPAVLVAGDTL
ncbi:transglycosylase SLT domain-containing protein [Azoarcus indigens]|uniref:Sel1 repeat-containing protein n=1 Tax=Azoarcus indigens TaxID=29545 RepID=A0A4R6DJF0_9RHOO|nr:transglycosylase SLT domain-containing protein [Azoarcus indigens]NMG67212.1 transglycosylase SLT domain-containing protein [Azoarcus indigens]TDN44514.1 Sel1 repeat-containing protein [Azoarcus indigens]